MKVTHAAAYPIGKRFAKQLAAPAKICVQMTEPLQQQNVCVTQT